MTPFGSTLRALSVAALLLIGGACDDSGSGGNATAACMTLCTSSGFTGSTIDEAPHEINCMCTGGSGGMVTDAACTTMCMGLGKGGQVYGSGAGQTANACQCQ